MMLHFIHFLGSIYPLNPYVYTLKRCLIVPFWLFRHFGALWRKGAYLGYFRDILDAWSSVGEEPDKEDKPSHNSSRTSWITDLDAVTCFYVTASTPFREPMESTLKTLTPSHPTTWQRQGKSEELKEECTKTLTPSQRATWQRHCDTED
jgi:hypothetical protein